MLVRASTAEEAGDVIALNGRLEGQSLDPLGVYNDAETIARWKVDHDNMVDSFKEAIDRHFKKIVQPFGNLPPLDKVVIDFKYMDDVSPVLKAEVIEYIENPLYQYKNYVNNDYLIKLNF